MIVLEKNVATTFIVPLLESTTIDPVYYLLELTSSTDDVSYFFLETLLISIERYSKIELTVDLPVGEYLYKIYECDADEPTIDDAVSVVHIGICAIIDDGIIDTIYE